MRGDCRARNSQTTTSWSPAIPIDTACLSVSPTAPGTQLPFPVCRPGVTTTLVPVTVSHSIANKDGAGPVPCNSSLEITDASGEGAGIDPGRANTSNGLEFYSGTIVLSHCAPNVSVRTDSALGSLAVASDLALGRRSSRLRAQGTRPFLDTRVAWQPHRLYCAHSVSRSPAEHPRAP